MEVKVTIHPNPEVAKRLSCEDCGGAVVVVAAENRFMGVVFGFCAECADKNDLLDPEDRKELGLEAGEKC